MGSIQALYGKRKGILDKFYTHPDIAKRFVDVVNQYFPLDTFDMVIETTAGCGNILQYLPSKFSRNGYRTRG